MFECSKHYLLLCKIAPNLNFYFLSFYFVSDFYISSIAPVTTMLMRETGIKTFQPIAIS
jgi:hypothetical protein